MSEITEEQAEEIFRQYAEGKSNLHSFFTNVIKAKDTTKTGNLKEEELGLPKLPLRTLKELKLFAENVLHQKRWADYFNELSEIQTSTSLSKDALLLRLSVTQKKELADVTPSEKKQNKGWFKGKNAQEQ